MTVVQQSLRLSANVFMVLLLILSAGCQKNPAPKPQITTAVVIEPQDTHVREMDYLLVKLQQANPFRPDHATDLSKAADTQADLKGIIWDERSAYALIGNNVVVEGDTIADKKVIKINRDSVVLDNQGNQEILRLKTQSK